jgi:hypothetical protein
MIQKLCFDGKLPVDYDQNSSTAAASNNPLQWERSEDSFTSCIMIQKLSFDGNPLQMECPACIYEQFFHKSSGG